MTGTVKCVKPEKGFGFIRRAAGEPDVFFHIRDTSDELPFKETLAERTVEFEVIETDRGPKAINVRAAP